MFDPGRTMISLRKKGFVYYKSDALSDGNKRLLILSTKLGQASELEETRRCLRRVILELLYTS